MIKPGHLLLLVGLLSGCVSDRVVLLPSPDGAETALVVRDASGERVLDRPYAATNTQALAAPFDFRASPEYVETRYAAVLQALPRGPVSHVLYFETGGDRLTQASLAELSALRQQIASWQASEIMVIGHTDRVGSLAANDALSAKRAEAVRELLIGEGIPAEKLEVAGRGEREPLVPTADEVDEPRNRRVEINVR